MEMLRRAMAEDRRPDLNELINAIPYCRFVGMQVDQKGSELTTILKFSHHLIGNPVLPALHGGVVGAFLETTAMIQVLFELRGPRLPKPVDINIDYLRSGRPVDLYGRAVITKQGRRVVNVHAEAWQDQHTKPIAALRGHFLVPDAEES